MKLFCTLTFGLVIKFTFAQFSDVFDLNSTFPIPWEGQTNEFLLHNGELKLNSSGTGNSTIYLPPSFFYYSDIEIDLKIRIPFAPSANNRLNLFIYSDSIDVSSASNALYIQLGESGSNDAVVLKGIVNGTDIELSRGLDGRLASSFEISLRLTQTDSLVNIDLWSDSLQNYQPEISYVDTNNHDWNTLALECHYTSSNSTNFFFDDLYVGPIIIDTIPPFITEISIIDSTQIEVYFSEELDTSTFTLNQFTIDNPLAQSPIGYAYTNAQLSLQYAGDFSNNQMSHLTLDSLRDQAGNMVFIDTNIHVLYGEEILVHDLEITEIMSDPNPTIGLPICEYVEVFNSSNKVIDLSHLYFADLTDTVAIDSSVFLFPNEYILICDQACLDSFPSVNRIGINMPTLNNTTDRVSIFTSDYLVDSIRFENSWHSANKDDGGYALEKASLGYFCTSENWLSSIDSMGGTPGIENSVLTSLFNHPFSIDEIEIIGENLIQITFNKVVEQYTNNALFSCNYTIINTIAQSNIVDLNIGPPIYEGDDLILEIQNLADCFGNTLDTIIEMTAPILPSKGNLVINEILFDPSSGGTDYVELYNKADTPLNLKDISLANFNDTVSNHKIISSSQFILPAQQYCLISKDSIWVKNVFRTDNQGYFIEISSLPSYSNDFGDVLLINAENEIIDHVKYDVNMHYPLLNDYENKSLERISFDAPSNDRNNWNTASANLNYGTPGYQNSQAIFSNSSLDFDLSPDVFTPNNDGNKDNVCIQLNIEEAGIYSLYIYNLEGQLLNKLIDGVYLSQ